MGVTLCDSRDKKSCCACRQGVGTYLRIVISAVPLEKSCLQVSSSIAASLDEPAPIAHARAQVIMNHDKPRKAISTHIHPQHF